jgi:tRNA dimethylallyltransferase
MIVILGPTASGKTSLAANVAYEFDGEIISADSRQVYKGLDIGTGKDLGEYRVGEKMIRYHLIDIVSPGYEYNLFEFHQDFLKTFQDIKDRKKLPILCGGSGLYIEAVLRGFHLIPVENDPEVKKSLQLRTDEELINLLKGLRPLHNTTDILDRQRLIKAIEIATHSQTKNGKPHPPTPALKGEGETEMKYIIFGIRFEREVIKKRITERLERRLQHGLIEEVQQLLDTGLSPDQLKFWGLEYRFVTLFLQQEINYNEMFKQLNIAIRQFAKRQMTWFRKMERSGFTINWIDGELGMDQKIGEIKSYLNRRK